MPDRNEPDPKPDAENPGGSTIDRGTWIGVGFGFLIAFLVSGAGALLMSGSEMWRDPVSQPIAFNHRLHVEDVELECLSCHQFYEEETFSGMPTAEDCWMCHEEALGTSEEEAKLVRLLAKGEVLEWNPLFRQPAHVFYTHRRHVVLRGMDCADCHGSIGTSESPPDRVGPLLMDDCIDCHTREEVTNDCTACHR